MAEQWDYEEAFFYVKKTTDYEGAKDRGGNYIVRDWTMTVDGHTTTISSMKEGLQTLGSSGWELVHVVSQIGTNAEAYTAFFKRRKQS